MKIQLLIATINQKGHSLLKRMNIRTDAIVCNQCDKNEVEIFNYKHSLIRWYSFAEKGVGLNRNNALMRADSDIVVFADDDMIYVDDYENIINKAFSEIADADVIVFNLNEKNETRYIIKKVKRVRRINYLRYGTARIAAKLSRLRENNIYFNQCFGGGTEHCHGEDSIFLCDCLDKHLRIYAYPAIIAELTEQRKSSWNIGINEKYIQDQGVLFRRISRRWWKLLCLQDVIRHRKRYGISWIKAYFLMIHR